LFPWRQLAGQVGAWPDASGWRFISTVGHRINRLIALNCWIRSRYGYQVTPEMTPRKETVIMAFQMHFRPALGWRRDAQTQAIAEALLEKYGLG
jgi:N-acetylmuramoyl-L-alanine amidase